MSAARFWRAVGIESWGGAELELSAFHLYQSSGAREEHFANVVALLHGDGSDGATSIVDSSAAPKTFTCVGGAAITTAQSMFGGASIALDGGPGGRVQASEQSADFSFGTGDFTIEFWARKTADTSGGYDVVLDTSRSGSGTGGWFVELSSLRGLVMYSPSAFLVSAPLNPNDGLWHHWAICRAGTTCRAFKDGGLLSTTTNSTNIPASQPLWVGNATTGTRSFAGQIDDLRITKGVARYTEAFLPPAAAHPNMNVISGDVRGDVRVDDAATLTATMPPVSGALTALQDGDALTTVRFDPRPSGFALVWDFGVGGEANIRIPQLGASTSQKLFLARYILQYSADGKVWSTQAMQGTFGYPGANTMTDVAAPVFVPPEPRSEVSAGSAVAIAPLPAHAAPGALQTTLARDVEFGGNFKISDTVAQKGEPNNIPLRRRVRLHRSVDGMLVAETWSSESGHYAFYGLTDRYEYDAIAWDHLGVHRSVVANNIKPEPM